MGFKAAKTVVISPPNLQSAKFKIIGTAPLVQNKFSSRVLEGMAADQAAGPSAKKKTKRDAKDFDLCVKEATHIAEDGWCGLPASAVRQIAAINRDGRARSGPGSSRRAGSSVSR